MWHLQNRHQNVTTIIHIVCNIHAWVILWNLVIWFIWFLVTRGGVYKGLCNNKIFTILREAYNSGVPAKKIRFFYDFTPVLYADFTLFYAKKNYT